MTSAPACLPTAGCPRPRMRASYRRATRSYSCSGRPWTSTSIPSYSDLLRVVARHLTLLHDGQLLVLRSTVFPGTSERVRDAVVESGKDIDVAFCPERIAEGHALAETVGLPQIVSSFTQRGLSRARELFSSFSSDIVELSPAEAELAKLFTNVWRYIRFAIANQFFSIANDHGIDYYRIHKAITHNYPRVRDLPTAGFAAGPCLLKDTMQLAAFGNHNFFLGHSAMLVNEGQPDYIVACLKARHRLHEMTAGVLGAAFKADSDDPRESLAFRLRKLLEIECRQVLITDPYVKDARIRPLDEVIGQSDILVLAAPHAVYKDLDLAGKRVVDIWNFYGKGGLIA